MSARIIDGVAIGKSIRAEVAVETAKLAAKGIKPGLAVVLVGENPASQVYVRSKDRGRERGRHLIRSRSRSRATPPRPICSPRSIG